MYIDLFAGCGGLSLGLKNAGWEGLFAVEKNEDAFKTLRYNLIDNGDHFQWPEWLPRTNHDINELLENYSEEIAALRGNVSLIVGGPPCQGFSMAGQRTGKDSRNRLYNSYIKFVELVQPEMLFFENVHGFTVGFKRKYRGKETKGEAYSEKLIRELKRLGYNVAYSVVLMSDYGVPQKRKRFILFAIRNGNPEVFFDRLASNRVNFLQQKNLNLRVTVSEAIGDLRRAYGEVESPDTHNFMNGIYGPIRSQYQMYMRQSINNLQIPDSHRFARPRQDTVELFERLMEACDEAIRITPRMNLVEGLRKRGVTPLKENCICPTITSIPDDFVHYAEPRIMTVRECARIQSFPDDYKFCGKYTTGGARRKIEVPRYTQVANAVPPLFAEQVGVVLREMMEIE
ncbi:MAG: DNA cytosine methyltransferase [Agathobacter sp.]|nr:DNA cytosine methyltransferase [Agathobacter sp.]